MCFLAPRRVTPRGSFSEDASSFLSFLPISCKFAPLAVSVDLSSSAKAEADICCDNCGIAEVDEVKMEEEECSCKLLRSCSDKCREDHQEQYDIQCKKQGEDLHDDDDLFTQPDSSYLGECPLCFLQMPLDPKKSTFHSCCSKIICNGCRYAHERSNGGSCPFCREPTVNKEENEKRTMKRVKANDPAALLHMGTKHCDEGDFDSALTFLAKAAELGDAEAHHQLGIMYWMGVGVEEDEEKAVYHSEQAAIGGHPEARYCLGCVEEENGNIERAVKHYIITANLGDKLSMKELWKYYSAGAITKED